MIPYPVHAVFFTKCACFKVTDHGFSVPPPLCPDRTLAPPPGDDRHRLTEAERREVCSRLQREAGRGDI